MKEVKITVLKTTLDRELAAEYGVEGLTACPMYVFALAHGAGTELFYYGDWIRTPGVAICSCNDGLRPVIFKLEATETPSQMEYAPVR